MNKQLKEIRDQLYEISNAEAMKLLKLARNLDKRGVSKEVTFEIRDEAMRLYDNRNPEMLLDPSKSSKYKYAFKF